jgi:asparagine synthase (glutamine-hydrolysing)
MLQQMHDPRQPDPPPNMALLAALTIPAVRSVARRVPVWPRRQRGFLGTLLRSSRAPVVDPNKREQESAIAALGPMSDELFRRFHGPWLGRLLRNFDVHSMGHAIQLRMPFLDWRVVSYALSVPDESKAAAGYTKHLLREAMRGVLPDPLRLRRHKTGYNAPVANWLAGGLSSWLWDEVNDREFLRSELWDGPALLALARSKRETNASWHPQEAHRVLLAVTAHWWLTRWMRPRPGL